MATKQKGTHGGKRAGAGKPKGVRVTQATRERIRGAMLVRRLEDIATGKVFDAEPHQVTAALGLLRFQLPTLQATDITSNNAPLEIKLASFAIDKDGKVIRSA